jgi:hypothetical protein
MEKVMPNGYYSIPFLDTQRMSNDYFLIVKRATMHKFKSHFALGLRTVARSKSNSADDTHFSRSSLSHFSFNRHPHSATQMCVYTCINI